MKGPAVHGVVRVIKVLALYAMAGSLFWMAIPGIQRTFLLPMLFGTVARGAVLAGAALAAWVAWSYPSVGRHDEGVDGGSDGGFGGG